MTITKEEFVDKFAVEFSKDMYKKLPVKSNMVKMLIKTQAIIGELVARELASHFKKLSLILLLIVMSGCTTTVYFKPGEIKVHKPPFSDGIIASQKIGTNGKIEQKVETKSKLGDLIPNNVSALSLPGIGVG